MIAPHRETADALVDAPHGIPLVAVEAGPVGRSRWSRSTSSPARRRRLGTCSTSGTRRCGTSPDRLDWLESGSGSRAGGATLEAGGRQDPGAAGWRLERARRLRARPQAQSARRASPAIFVANDQMALGVLRAMHEAGREIPAEVSVVGFDDIPEAPYFTPPLTTVRQDFNEVGSRSAAAAAARRSRPARACRRAHSCSRS